MNLILFLDACEHVSKICRVLRQPKGNMLLMGVGGSGRQSLTKLATYIQEYNCFQIEVIKGYDMRSWKDDLREALLYCGVDDKPMTFLFTDTQIISEAMLEDVNNVLNTGDVPNIYRKDDEERI